MTVDHIPLARPVHNDGLDGFVPACLCGWQGPKCGTAEAGSRTHARTWARAVAERHACDEEDRHTRTT